jgi:hypothetical protein
VKAWDGKQNENRAWNPTYLIGLPSTIDPVPLETSFTVLPAGFEAVVLTISSRYLSAQAGCRNEAAITISADGSEPSK